MDALPHDSLEGLPLLEATPPEWARVVEDGIDLALVDHAHCELKAASTALGLLGRYGHERELAQDLTALAREEMRHFERVHELVLERGLTLSRPAPDRYVQALRGRVQRGRGVDLVFLDSLVVCAFVEARSCERFRVLAREVRDEPLRAFYKELALAEARHHELFLIHAARRVGEAAASERVREVAALEAELVRSLPHAPRIH